MTKPRRPHQHKTLFPNNRSYEFEGDNYVYNPAQGHCGICGRKTHHKSLLAVEYCCSRECSRELWYQIFERILTGWMSNRKNRNNQLKSPISNKTNVK